MSLNTHKSIEEILHSLPTYRENTVGTLSNEVYYKEKDVTRAMEQYAQQQVQEAVKDIVKLSNEHLKRWGTSYKPMKFLVVAIRQKEKALTQPQDGEDTKIINPK